jgi:hypothetical protein
LRNFQDLLKTLKETGQELDARPNPLGGAGFQSGNIEGYIRTSLAKLRLPTCYENPLIFFMLTEYAKRIDQARRDLRMPLPSEINLATLPTTEINAYTYPATTDVGSVIALNAQLFMFA